MSRKRKQKLPRGVVDTSTLVAGIAGFKSGRAPANPSARLLRDWIERGHFVWLVTEEILDEYKAILARKGVRRPLIGKIVNLLREEAEVVRVRRGREWSPDPADDPFCACAEAGTADFIVTLNRKDFPQDRLRSTGDPSRRPTARWGKKITAFSRPTLDGDLPKELADSAHGLPSSMRTPGTGKWKKGCRGPRGSIPCRRYGTAIL